MKTLIASLAAALLLLALAAGGASAKQPAPPCAKEGKTLAATSTARVYTTTAKVVGPEYGDAVVETRTYGCLLATMDRLRLDERCSGYDLDEEVLDPCLDRPARVAVNGRYVAVAMYAQEGVRDEPYYDFITWARLGAKPVARRVVAADEATLIHRLYVSPLGALAYGGAISDSSTKPSVPTVGYFPPIRPGKPSGEQTLDSGGAVATKSLRAGSGKLTWKSGGKVRTAAFR